MDQLLVLVRSSSIDAVEGGMRALSDFISISITEDQLLPIARDMLPTLLSILGSPQVSYFSLFLTKASNAESASST
jgi:hypothetical protein